MANFEYGPVDLYLIGFPGERPGPDVVASIVELIEAGTVKLLDMLFVSRSLDGQLNILEVDQVADELGLTGIELNEVGLAGNEDIEKFADDVAPGTSAALLVVELLWAKNFATALYRAGGAVLHTESIPSVVVNELLQTSSVD